MDGDTDLFRQIVGLGSLGGGEPRRGEYTGTKALMIAVLEDAIRDYLDAPGRQSIEAHGWVASNRRDAFSFTVICETLGLEPSAVRQALVRLKDQSALPPRRVRQNASRYRSPAKVP